jgi:RNA polymerase sigma-70 factor (ECF subfamily)
MVMASAPSVLTVESLHTEYGGRIRRYLTRLVGTTEAEDLTQEVFEKAQRALCTFRGGSIASQRT